MNESKTDQRQKSYLRKKFFKRGELDTTLAFDNFKLFIC